MKKIMLIGVTVMLALSVFTFMSCDWLIEEIVADLATPYGTVVDGKTGLGVDSAIVTLTDSGGATYSVTTTSSGSYDFNTASNQPNYGDYSLTAEKSGYAFTPLQVSISGLAQKFDTVVGVPSTSDGLLFVLMWDDGVALDVDAYMTYPDASATSPINGGGSAIDYEAYVTNSTSYGLGFAPELGNTNRGEVSTWTSAIPEIVLDVDDSDGTGPETISVGWTMPWSAGDDTTIKAYDIDDLNIDILDDSSDYLWAGTLEYYVDGFDTTVLSTQGSYEGAHPVLYIFSGVDCLGIYDVPDYTDVDTASLARIQVFTDATIKNDAYYFAIYPDIRLIPGGSTAIRALSTGENTPLIVSRK